MAASEDARLNEELDGLNRQLRTEVAAIERELADAQRMARSFGSALGDALESGVVKGNALGDVLRSLGARLSSIALASALKPVETAFGSIFSRLTQGLFGGLSPISGGGLSAPGSLGGGLGAIAATTAEADPRRQEGPRAPQPVTVNIATPDAESFRRAETQVTASLARAVARGRRGL